MSSVRGVNIGGNLFGVTDSTNIAPIATTNFATRAYAKDRCFIMVDGLLYRATAEIESGDPIVINGNCKRTTLDEIISVIETDSDLIAPTEDGATSSADYAVGNEIVRSGILYKVISAITQGDAFAIGSNIDIAGSLTSQIKVINGNEDAMLNVLGAKNLLPINATTQTINGVTFTVNSDGSITANGTATGSTAVLTLCSKWGGQLTDGKQYILSGCPTQSSAGYRIEAFGNNTSLIQDTGSGAKFTSNGDSLTVRIVVNANETVNATFYPMIRSASVEDDTYVPYAMTNRELTELTEKYPAILYESTSDAGLKSLDIDLSKWAIVLLMIRFASTKCNSPVILTPGQSFTVGTPTELNNGEVVNERYCAYGHSSTSNITIDEIGYFSSSNNWQSRMTGTLAANYGLFKVIGLIRR